jgi:hypothetical protein
MQKHFPAREQMENLFEQIAENKGLIFFETAGSCWKNKFKDILWTINFLANPAYAFLNSASAP